MAEEYGQNENKWPPLDEEIWIKASGGRKHGRIYGLPAIIDSSKLSCGRKSKFPVLDNIRSSTHRNSDVEQHRSLVIGSPSRLFHYNDDSDDDDDDDVDYAPRFKTKKARKVKKINEFDESDYDESELESEESDEISDDDEEFDGSDDEEEY